MNDFLKTTLLVIVSFLLGFYIGLIKYDELPKAMDVYQGKTTLRYEIVDGVKIDSIVIFKNEK